MKDKEKKRIKAIRKAIGIIENATLFISFCGALGLIMTVFLAPIMFESTSGYYVWLFGSIGAILAAPALAWLEYEISNSGKGDKNELDK